MKRYIAFLRGINVSGQKLIKMAVLKEYFEKAGFKNVVTYIQSGNVLFDTKAADEERLRRRIEKHLAKELGYEVPVVIRTIAELKEVIAQCPLEEPADGSARLYIYYFSAAPATELYASLEPYRRPDETIIISGREAFFLSPRFGESKLTNTLIEKKMGVVSTARNWATTNKIVSLAES